MIDALIQQRKTRWLADPSCPAQPVLAYARKQGKLRTAQLDALETYLFLKLAGNNKPLWQLLAEGFFARDDDLSRLPISQVLRDELGRNPALKGLFDLARSPATNGKPLFPELEAAIKDDPQAIAAERILKQLFYGIEYTDYLFSLPMGAGKTWLMAAIMYLDLYFARNEPDNPAFAHNFLVMIPSGLKSSLAPSLRTILHFDPAWVLPEPSASEIRKLLKFEVLDQPRSAQKNNQARSPNAQKVASYQPFDTQMGLVLIVNAEKVILDRLEVNAQLQLIERSDDDQDRQANELRNIIGKINRLQIHIDEVHHAATDDIKLRQVVGKWGKGGNLNSVLGFSGTPYLSKPETLELTTRLKLKTAQISNTVFYFPLLTAIRQFLKTPRVEQASGLQPLQLVERGVKDFLQHWGDKHYADNTCAKLAIYCGSIERLEEQVYPHLLSMGIAAEHILKYHKGNKHYKLPKENETEFLSLDTPLSRKKIILLVQVGKEGWDCRSLTGVILSQKGDCPTNMVLQTACRCLRQMDGGNEGALIWLNEDNAKTLDKQLQDEQHTSIAELNAAHRPEQTNGVERVSRKLHLRLPSLAFYQMRLQTRTVLEDASPVEDKLVAVDAAQFTQATARITSRALDADLPQRTRFDDANAASAVSYREWLFAIAKGSYGTLPLASLQPYDAVLRQLFAAISESVEGQTHLKAGLDHTAIQSKVRLAFHSQRTLAMVEEIIAQEAEILLVDKLHSVEPHDLLFPKPTDCQKILELDASNAPLSADEATLRLAWQAMSDSMTEQGLGNFVPPWATFMQQNTHPATVQNKERTFHYLPYDFRQSGFEATFLQAVLTLDAFQDKPLEIYYNGERALTDFQITCYQPVRDNGWRKVGQYTPDFLIVQRKGDAIHKILIVETKGKGYAEQPAFQQRKAFVEQHFVPFNNRQFGYGRFDYLTVQDDDAQFLLSASEKISEFFRDNEKINAIIP